MVRGGPPPPPPPSQPSIVNIDPEKLRQEIRAGVRLRPTQTVDKSKPFIQAEGEVLQIKKLPVLEASTSAYLPPQPPPPPPTISSQPVRFAHPPPPPPPIQRTGKTPSLPKASLGPGDRDRLLNEIRQGRRLRHVETVDKSRPVVAAEEGFEETSPPPKLQTNGHHNFRDEYQPLTPPVANDGFDDTYAPVVTPVNGFMPSYGKLSTLTPQSVSSASGHSPTPSTTSSEKVKADVGFYTDAPPPPPSTNPLVDESSYGVDNMVGVFDNMVQEEVERERTIAARLAAPRGRVNTALFEPSRSASLTSLQVPLPKPPSNGHSFRRATTDDRIEVGDDGYEYHVTPAGTRYRSRSKGNPSLPNPSSSPTTDTSHSPSSRPQFRADSPPQFVAESFPIPDSFNSEEILAGRYVSPVQTESLPSAKNLVATFETKARGEQKEVRPPRVLPSSRQAQHPTAAAFQQRASAEQAREDGRKRPEQVYAAMANREKFAHELPTKANRDDFSRVPWRPSYSGPQAFIGLPKTTPPPTKQTWATLPRRTNSTPFSSQELIAGRFVADADPRSLPGLTPTSERAISEVQRGMELGSGLRRRSGSRGASEMERTLAEVHIRRAEDEERQLSQSRTDLLLQQPQAPKTPTMTQSPNSFPARRSASSHQLYAQPPSPRAHASPASGDWSSEREAMELAAELPSVADLRGAFEGGGDGAEAGVPWQRLFHNDRGSFLPDVGRLAEGFEERSARAEAEAMRLRSSSIGARRNTAPAPTSIRHSSPHSPEDSSGVSSQASSLNGEPRYPAAFLPDELHKAPPRTSAPQLGAVPWRITKKSMEGGAPAQPLLKPGRLGFPDPLLSPTREDVFALRDFHRAQLAQLESDFASRLFSFPPP